MNRRPRFKIPRLRVPMAALIAAGAAGLAFVSVMVLQFDGRRALHGARVELGTASSDWYVAAHTPTPSVQSDFVARLPSSEDATPILQLLRKSFGAAGLTIITATMADPASGTSALVERRVSLQVRGAYPMLKAALNDATARQPRMILATLRIETGPAKPEVQAQIELLVPQRRVTSVGPSDKP